MMKLANLTILSFSLAMAFAEIAQAQTTLPASSIPTAFTMSSGTERAPEQLAMVFEKADLSLKLDPQTRSVSGTAILSFTASAELKRIVVELDKNLLIESVSVNGQSLPADAISNPEGRLYLTLNTPLKKAERADVTIRIRACLGLLVVRRGMVALFGVKHQQESHGLRLQCRARAAICFGLVSIIRWENLS